MHSISIFVLAFGLLAGVAMARPGRRPGSGHYQPENPENEVSQGNHGYKFSAYRLPTHIRLPHLLAGKLGEPKLTYIAKKILDGKYLVISPALIFKLKDDTDTETGTTAVPESSTDQPDVVETTTVGIDEETTTEAELKETEGSGEIPSFLRKRSLSINDNEQLLFLDE